MVLCAVAGGFLLEQGNLLVLFQPAELLIIVGSAIGILLAANPAMRVLEVLRGTVSAFRRSPYTRATIFGAEDALRVVQHRTAARHGRWRITSTIPIRAEYSRLSPSSDATKRRWRSVRLAAHADQRRRQTRGTGAANGAGRGRTAPRTPRRGERAGHAGGFAPRAGIVAAVLGVVVTMQALVSAPEQIAKGGAALVGTFLGILLCYGVVGPLASHLDASNQGRAQLLAVHPFRIAVLRARLQPAAGAEFARRSIPASLRAVVRRHVSDVPREVQLAPFPKPGGENEAAAPEYAG